MKPGRNIMTVNTIFEILKKNNNILKKHHVKKIGLFGSFVRGEQTESSDIDVLVIFDDSAFGKNFKGYFDTLTSLSADLSSLFNKNIDLVTEEMLSPYIAPEVMKEVDFFEEI